jgi:hypothetical protein
MEKYNPFEDHCLDCTNFDSEKKVCKEKGYTLTGYESADNCWAFRGSDWRSKEPYEELL